MRWRSRASLDEERKAGKMRGPLHGIPVLIKDNIDTADHMHTTAGSLALADAHRRQRLVRRRAAARRGRGDSRQNESQRVGELPFDAFVEWMERPRRADAQSVCARSQSVGLELGVGAAAAANCCAVAVGTETDGSVTSPAAAAALVGIKPTVGLISRAGIIPIAHSQDTAGPMARTVRDAAILLGALTGVDPRDAATRGSAGHSRPTTRRRSTRTGCAARASASRERSSRATAPRPTRCSRAALDLMRQHGATIVDPADIATAGETDESEFDLLLYEFKADLNAYLGRVEPSVGVRSLADVIAFNTKNAARELRYFGQEIMEKAAEERAAHREEVSRRAGEESPPDGRAGNRCDDRRSTSSMRSSRRRRGRRG